MHQVAPYDGHISNFFFTSEGGTYPLRLPLGRSATYYNSQLRNGKERSFHLVDEIYNSILYISIIDLY